MRQFKITSSITKRDSQSIEKFLADIAKEPLLSAEEEVELAKRIRKGDQEALNKLVNGNLRFVVSVAKQYQSQGLTLNDLINEGNVGLIKAAQKFDETRGFKFISYAVWWIRQSIMQALAEQSRLVRLPLNKVALLTKVKKTMAMLEHKLDREPTLEEVGKELDMSPKEVQQMLSLSSRHSSLDAPLQEGESTTVVDLIKNDNAEYADEHLDYKESLKIETERTLSQLSTKQRDIIRMYFGIGFNHPMSYDDIGEHLGMTRERVRQLKDRAIDKLQSVCKNSEELKSFLGK
jgi:RNA polymerase primary sigma factor